MQTAKELTVPYRSANPATKKVFKTFPEPTDQEMTDASAKADNAKNCSIKAGDRPQYFQWRPTSRRPTAWEATRMPFYTEIYPKPRQRISEEN